MGARQLIQDLAHFFSGQHGGQTFWSLGADGMDGQIQVLLENLAVQEEQRVEGLVLGGGSNFLLDSQVGEEGFDLGAAHFPRMAFVVEEDVAFDPVNIGLLGADGVVFAPDGLTDLVKELLGAFLHYASRIAVDSERLVLYNFYKGCPRSFRKMSCMGILYGKIPDSQ